MVITLENLHFSFYALYRHGMNGPVLSLEDSSALKHGDVYKILFSAQESCYVYLFQVDNTGEVEQLFPASSYTGLNLENVNPVQSGRRYAVPAHNKFFEVVEQSHLQALYLLAFRRRNAQLEEQYQEMLKAHLNDDQMSLKRIRKTFQTLFSSSAIVRISPRVQQQYAASEDAKQTDNRLVSVVPNTERQIVEALRARFSIKGASETDIDKLPRAVAYIQFVPGSTEIHPSSLTLLQAYGRALEGDELCNAVILIAGYTHGEKNDQQNMKLSQLRVEAVKQFLLNRYLIAEKRLLTKGYGTGQTGAGLPGNHYADRIEFIRIK